jgi:hypothetical protein
MMTDYFSSFVTATIHAFNDLIARRTWTQFGKAVWSFDGLIVAISYAATALLLLLPFSSLGNVFARAGLLILVGIFSLPSMVRLLTVVAARSAAVHYPGLFERNWPRLSQVALDVLPLAMMLLCAAIPLFIFAPPMIAFPVLSLLSVVLLYRPIFRFSTHLYLTHKEADRVLEIGKWQDLPIAGFNGHQWLVWTGLLFLTSSAAWYGVDAMSHLFGLEDDTSTTKLSMVLALETVASVVIGLFSSLLMAHLYLPTLADLFRQKPPSTPNTVVPSVETGLSHSPEPAKAASRPKTNFLSAFRNCPISVVIVATLLLFSGAIGTHNAIDHLSRFGSMNPFDTSEFIGVENILYFCWPAILVICGVFMLVGANWARWLYIAGGIILLGLTFVSSGMIPPFLMLVTYALTAFFLVRAPAAAYFKNPDGVKVGA